jgi:hypothetical protein
MEIRLQTKANETLSLYSSHRNSIKHFLKKLPISNPYNLFFKNKKKKKFLPRNTNPTQEFICLTSSPFATLSTKILSSITTKQNIHANPSQQMNFHSSSQSNLQQSNNNHMQNVNTQNKAPSFVEYK